MTAVIALALLARQDPPPTLPTGTSPAFAQAALVVEAKLQANDVAGAREAARALPLRTPRVKVDDSGLTAALRAVWADTYARAVGSWSRSVPGFAPIATDESPDVVIRFQSVLPEGKDGLPSATVVEFGTPFQATIGLSRGKPAVPLRKEELGMEIAYALGRYLGVNEAPFPGGAMFRDPRPGLLTFWPQRADMAVAAANLDLADRLRAGIEAGKPIGLTVPSAKLDKAGLDLGTVRQGQPIYASISIENTGSGVLAYDLEPDCSCFAKPPPGRIKSGAKASIPVIVNTQESLGRQDKRLLLRTNDPQRPQIEIPVTFAARPAYRLFRPTGDHVTVPDEGGTYDIFLFTEPGSPVHPISARWDGIDAKLDWAPWSGTLADPELGEGPLPRKGWRFRVRVSPKLIPGQSPGTLTVVTDSPMYRRLRYSLYAQKGIVNLNESVYFADMEPGARASMLITRPNVPFKILGVDAGPLKATWTATRGSWEYRVDLEYPGGAPKGDFQTTVKIRTDDPKQPVVEGLATGNVK